MPIKCWFLVLICNFSFCAQLLIQMITVRCWWLVDITLPSKSLPQRSPTTSSWGLCWSICALSTRVIQHAHECCLKVGTDMLYWTWQRCKQCTYRFSILYFDVIGCDINSKSSKNNSIDLLTVIGQRLAAMNLLSPLAISDEFSTVRLQHNRAFTELLNAASSSLYPQVTGHIANIYKKGFIVLGMLPVLMIIL